MRVRLHRTELWARVVAFLATHVVAAACVLTAQSYAQNGTRTTRQPSTTVPATVAYTGPAPRIDTTRLPEVPRDFRAAWVASVANIDWPSKRTLTSEQQQAELIALLDRAVALNLNAIILQVRPAADALYESKIEPWSEYLTGTQGKAPEPYYDPLTFAVNEAHARGIELHAWFNPYRAKHTDARSPLVKSHIARQRPDLVKPYAGYLWMDPGEKAVRERTLKVVLDVVQRYDIDGVHIDDYFYPYPETTRRGRPIPFPDATSWKRYVKSGGKLGRADWRRNNVDLLVEALNSGIHKVKPWVKFGISPFGIWRPGFPAQVKGLDSYEKLYGDSRKWLREGWADYFTPQLYWPTTRYEQSYAALLKWWVGENSFSRHMWPGNFTSRVTPPGTNPWSAGELVEQVRVTRLQPGASGNVHFSMKAFLDNQGSVNDSLLAGPYQLPALVPSSPWMKVLPPPVPVVAFIDTSGVPHLTLATVDGKPPWLWLVRARVDTGWITAILPGATTRWPVPGSATPQTLAVNAINRAGEESDPITALLPRADIPRDTARSGGRQH